MERRPMSEVLECPPRDRARRVSPAVGRAGDGGAGGAARPGRDYPGSPDPRTPNTSNRGNGRGPPRKRGGGSSGDRGQPRKQWRIVLPIALFLLIAICVAWWLAMRNPHLVRMDADNNAATIAPHVSRAR
ncbi:hypothetical protein WT14_21770 [Burkholderia stagnalis]|nr:hypothetical protein WT14_21770 [Burkholderia stagnalis]